MHFAKTTCALRYPWKHDASTVIFKPNEKKKLDCKSVLSPVMLFPLVWEAKGRV